LGEKCGVDLAYMAYLDAIGRPVETCHQYKDGVPWVGIKRDYAAFRAYQREGELSLFGWLQSLMGPKACAVYSVDDLKPFFATSYHFWKEKLGRK
ncbi:MAG: hypothetical protein O7F12_00095, partial [Nitrospirae bacterium]|nr:hypothetical protein [Nitrospirota bacterium]